MKISDVTSKLITAKTTGYTAGLSLGLAVASGYSKNKNFHKAHKPFAILSATATLAHIGLIEWYKHKYKNNL